MSRNQSPDKLKEGVGAGVGVRVEGMGEGRGREGRIQTRKHAPCFSSDLEVERSEAGAASQSQKASKWDGRARKRHTCIDLRAEV